MASTRDRNCLGDYRLEQKKNIQSREYSLYKEFGVPQTVQFAGDGLLMGRMANHTLSSNSCDIESQLFGIGANNLVKPKEKVNPDIIRLQSLSIIDRPTVLIPEPLFVEPNQRW